MMKINEGFNPPLAVISFFLAIASVLGALVTIATNDISLYKTDSLNWITLFLLHTTINAVLIFFGKTSEILRYSLIAINIVTFCIVAPRASNLWL